MKEKMTNTRRGIPLRECLQIPSDVGCFIPDSNFRKWIDIRTLGQS